MKRTLLTLFCTLLALAASADEGMWLPSLISQRIDDMRAKGFRLTAEDIYSVNKASMKDADQARQPHPLVGAGLRGGDCRQRRQQDRRCDSRHTTRALPAGGGVERSFHDYTIV